jgi:opacity protein-like surface antigen
MKRHLTAAIVATLLASTPALAAEHEGWFVNGMLGSASVDEDSINDDQYSADINLGYRWGLFGVEGGYVGFGSFDDTVSFPAPVGDIDTDLDLDGFKLGINLNANLNDHWSVMAHGGAFFWNADAHIARNGLRVSADADATDWYAGVGIDYNFNPNFSLGLGYDFYELSDGDFDSSIDTFGLRAEVRF